MCIRDSSEEMCKLAEIHTGLEVLNMAYEDMEFDEVFDGVWGNEALIHVPEDEIDSVMERVIEALCQGGILYLSFQEGDFEGIQNGRYFCQYTPVSYTHLVREEAWPRSMQRFPAMWKLENPTQLWIRLSGMPRKSWGYFL